MPTLVCHQENCTRCGTCVFVCPLHIIRLEPDAFPHFVESGPQRCIICGHCEAACPTAAISIEDPRLDPTRYPADLPPIPKERFAQHLRMRRSIRSFASEPLNKALLEELLDLLRYAPTGANRQELQWIAVYDTAELRRLTALVVDWMRHIQEQGAALPFNMNLEGMIKAWHKGHDPICRNAPHLLVVTTNQASCFETDQVDGIIALSYLDLAAPAYNIGTCWAGYFQLALESWQPLREAVGLQEGQQPIGSMLVGRPAVRYCRPPRRNRLRLIWR